MKSTLKLTIILGLTCVSQFLFGQKQFNVSDIKAAQDELDKLSIEWKVKVETKYAEADKLIQIYSLDNSTVSKETRQKRDEEVKSILNTADDLRNFYFGPTGEIFKKRQELINRLQG